MAGHAHRPHPPGKSKTALRRGHLTPGHSAAARNPAHPAPKATTHAEQALLFDLSHEAPRHAPHARAKR